MTSALLLLAIAAVVVLYGTLKVGRGRVTAHGSHVLAWRWLTGQPWHGKPVTDAGWTRRGERALTVTGHAVRFWYRPRWVRALSRTGRSLAVVAVAAGWVANPLLTAYVLLGITCAAVVVGCWLLFRLVTQWKHRRTWLFPTHIAAHEAAGIPRSARAASWIEVSPDRTRVVLQLPPGWPADAKDQQRLVSIVSVKLGIEAPDVQPMLTGPKPQLLLTRSDPPPALVTLEAISGELDKVRADEIIIGIGKQGVISKASLSSDSPHIGISMGSGGGKSNLAAFMLLQELRRGAIALVLDAKWISHPWLIGLPNVAYARTPAQLHAAMVWLSDELDRRNRVALRSVDVRGTVRANVGPRIFIVAEELNLAIPRLRSYWDEARDKSDSKRSPALIGLGEVAFAGRQVKMHLVLIGQMLTAAATGSKDSSVKENVGIKAMARYSPNAWKNMAPEWPMPPKPEAVGRIQLVTAGGVRETQVPLVDLEAARELVLAGTMTPCPAGMPGAPRVTETVLPALHAGSEQPVVAVAEPVPVAGSGAVTLSEAVRMGVVPLSLSSLRMYRHRDHDFPVKVGQRGLAHEFEPDAIAAWWAAREAV